MECHRATERLGETQTGPERADREETLETLETLGAGERCCGGETEAESTFRE